jgi:Fic family protein
MKPPKPAKKQLAESVSRIEPARLENIPEAVSDVVAELSGEAAKLGKSLHPRTASNLAGLVRIMNTYYSNLIEGHNTRPREIERALAGEFEADKERRNLQLEAAAHVRVQAEIDAMFAAGDLPDPAFQLHPSVSGRERTREPAHEPCQGTGRRHWRPWSVVDFAGAGART